MTPEDYLEEVDVWPENFAFVEFFSALGSGAWASGMNGRSGIRYESLPFIFEMRGIPRKKWPQFYEAIIVMESAALEAMHSKT